jgi:hypothetical protein
MKQAAAPEHASKTGSSRRIEPSARPHGNALAPPDYGIDFVDHLSASAGPIQLNSSPRVLRQKTMFDGISSSPRVVAQRRRMNDLFGAPVQRRDREELPDEPEPAQRVMAAATVFRRETSAGLPAPRAAPGPKPNDSDLPGGLKSRVESLSGMSLDDVKVHYNSSRPAQLDALAYAQGRDIHIAPGQERHLPHEAWHVIQQAQGRVKPTTQLKGAVPVNDDAGLEREADEMGPKSDDPIAGGSQGQRRTDNIVQRVPIGTYKAKTPSADGTRWDRNQTGNHNGETVPVHIIAVMRNSEGRRRAKCRPSRLELVEAEVRAPEGPVGAVPYHQCQIGRPRRRQGKPCTHNAYPQP